MTRRLMLCAGLAALLRVGLIVQAGGCVQDPDNYLPLARSIVAGDGFVFNGRPTAYRPPLYPLLLAPLVALSGSALPWTIGAFHVALGVLTVVAVDGVARRMSVGERARLAATLITALDPVLAIQSRGVMTETLAAALAALALRGVVEPGRRGAVLGGLGFGLAALCRPSLLPGAVLVVAALLIFGGRRPAAALRNGVVLVAVVGLTLLPWGLRNRLVLGEFVWTTTHGGYTLALANNPHYYADVLNGPPGAVWSGANQTTWGRGITRATLTLTEPEADRAIRDGAIVFMSDHPLDAARASFARLGRFWGIAPSGAVYPRALRIATALWTVPFWLLALDGLLARGARSWAWAASVAVVLGLTAVHTFYWTDLRMRAPVVPALAVVAARSRALAERRPGTPRIS